jgi:hypothetical protein
MLIEQTSKTVPLSVVKKSGVKVIKMEPAVALADSRKKRGAHLSPPVDKFNTGYIKVKKHDPL